MTREQPWAGDTIPDGTGVIEVRVAEVRQFFNSMDPSPFREKDLDEGAVEFIVSWAKEFPANRALALLIHLDKPAVMPDAADVVRDAVHAFFARSSELSTQQLRQLLRIGRTSLIIGLVFLAVLARRGLGRPPPAGQSARSSPSGGPVDRGLGRNVEAAADLSL